ncbi:MAG: type II toxin-antitoxin system RelE/ParE family toxin [Chromatiaceae bacterium]
MWPIWRSIAADNPDAAARLLEEIDHKCLLLAGNPLLARARPPVAPEFGSFLPGNFLVPYRVLSDGVRSYALSTA